MKMYSLDFSLCDLPSLDFTIDYSSSTKDLFRVRVIKIMLGTWNEYQATPSGLGFISGTP
jgi:hypothetical protein